MWRRHDVADRLLDQRIVLVNGRLDDVLTDHVSRQLLLLGSTDPDRPIELHLSCREAELGASIALATAIDLIRADVQAIVSGMLGGPALALLCASAKRAAHRKATFVFSLPRESAEGNATELATKAQNTTSSCPSCRTDLHPRPGAPTKTWQRTCGPTGCCQPRKPLPTVWSTTCSDAVMTGRHSASAQPRLPAH